MVLLWMADEISAHFIDWDGLLLCQSLGSTGDKSFMQGGHQ